MNDPVLSDYGQACGRPSQVNRMMASFAADFRPGVDINLGLGYVNEQTIPRKLIHEAVGEIVENPQRYLATFNYGGPVGCDRLIAALRRFVQARPVAPLSEDVLGDRRFVVGSTGATSLLEAAASVLPRGIVLTADPIYYIFTDLLERLGFEIHALPEDEEGLSADALREKIEALGERAADIRMLYLVTVANPTCTITTAGRRRELMAIMTDLSQRLGRRVPVLLDTAYELLIHDPAAPVVRSALEFDPQGIAYEIGTLSKVLAPTLRIGYMIGRDGPLLRAIIQRVSDVGFSAPLLSQEVAARLLDEHIAQQIECVNEGYRDKARRVRRTIDTHLGEHLAQVRGGSAGFYYYLTFKSIRTDEASPLFQYLSRTTGDVAIDGPVDDRRPRVIYLPGEHCSHRSSPAAAAANRQLRLSYGYESAEMIEQAVAMMGEAAGHVARAAASEISGVR